MRDLLEKFNSPLFIVSERVIKEKYCQLNDALHIAYPNSKIAYSLKTNYLPAVCGILKDCGALAEVASGFEYWLAKKLGYRGSDIVFNGPYKKDDELFEAVKDGSVLNIDNYFELPRLEKIASQFFIKPKIGIRVNTNYSRAGSLPWNRFGFNIENGEAMAMFSKIKNEFENLNTTGIHIHLGTNISDVSVYRFAMEKVVDFIVDVGKNFNIKVEYIDVGGGFAVFGNKLKGFALESVPSVVDYINAIINSILKKLEYKPLLIFEPGRFLVAEAMTLLTKVISKKEINGVKTVTVDSSVSILREAAFIDFNILAVDKKNISLAPTIVFGSSCTQSDVLGRADLPPLDIGDILAIHNVGAYSLPRSSQWIFPRPAIVLIKDNGESEIVKKAESYEDLVHLDRFP